MFTVNDFSVFEDLGDGIHCSFNVCKVGEVFLYFQDGKYYFAVLPLNIDVEGNFYKSDKVDTLEQAVSDLNAYLMGGITASKKANWFTDAIGSIWTTITDFARIWYSRLTGSFDDLDYIINEVNTIPDMREGSARHKVSQELNNSIQEKCDEYLELSKMIKEASSKLKDLSEEIIPELQEIGIKVVERESGIINLREKSIKKSPKYKEVYESILSDVTDELRDFYNGLLETIVEADYQAKLSRPTQYELKIGK